MLFERPRKKQTLAMRLKRARVRLAKKEKLENMKRELAAIQKKLGK